MHEDYQLAYCPWLSTALLGRVPLVENHSLSNLRKRQHHTTRPLPADPQLTLALVDRLGLAPQMRILGQRHPMPTHFNHQLFTRRKHHPAGPHPDIQFRDLAGWNFFFRRVGVDGPMRFAEQRVEGAVGGAEVAGGAEVDERVDDGDFVF
jgi:hypothetical protein